MSGVALSLAWIARVVDGDLRGRDVPEVASVVTDSRAMADGDLFVALSGPRFDGHDFVEAALERGAAAAVVSRRWHSDHPAESTSGAVIVVEEPLRALQALAHAVRRSVPTRVVAITGSAGKTTTKELTAGALQPTYSVVKNKGNLNNHIGLPLSLMQLRTAPDMAVLELGMNHEGEIRTLVGIAEPDVRVWTNVGDAHMGFFSSSDAIADAKAEILEGADSSTLLVCSADDARITARRGSFPGRTVTFGESSDATVRAQDIEDRGVDGIRATVVTRHDRAVFETPLLGRANMANVLAATAVATESGVPLGVVRDRVALIGPADRRGAVRRLRDDVVVIDDSYNSSPAALTQAMRTLAHERRARGRVAVVGEMLELGAHTDALHEECGRVAASCGLRALFAVGGAPAQVLARAAVTAGMPAAAVRHMPTSAAAAAVVVEAVQPGDVVLVKGSRGTRCDVIVDRLVQERG
ncbi:MAG TPA: UDP-N-acetylmuramoyl-tripeptide--D-alanyl-D-alanine ligase [Vicinamibacterales bacterium]